MSVQQAHMVATKFAVTLQEVICVVVTLGTIWIVMDKLVKVNNNMVVNLYFNKIHTQM